MGLTRGRYVIVLVGFVVCFALLVVRSEGSRKILGTLFGNGVPWIISQEPDQETVEQAWIHCRRELDDNTEAIRDFDFYLQQAAAHGYNRIYSDAVPLTKIKLERTINDLPPQGQQTLLDCLKRKNFQFYTSDNRADSGIWFKKCFELVFGWSNIPRRTLKGHHHISKSRARAHLISKSRARAPARAPGVSATPSNAPSPSFLGSTSSPSPTPQPHSIAPAPSPLKNLKLLPPPPKVKHSPPHFGVPHPPPPSENSNSQNKLIIAVSVTAVVVIAFLAMFLFCCLRRNGNKVGPKDGQRDEKPLLNFCLSDMSGSSQKSNSVGNSSNQDLKTLSVANSMSIDNHGSSLAQGLSSEGASGSGNASLPPPPGRTAPPPTVPPPPPPKPPAPSPPPPPKVARPPPVPLAKPSPLGPQHRGRSSLGGGEDLTVESDGQKTKLKPFFWDKVLANPDQSMVWHELKTGSFQVNEEMMESLFGYTTTEKAKSECRKDLPFESPQHYIQIIDAKKSQNLAILLKALNVTTEEVCDALREGNELPTELVQTLLKMAPTTEEELKLRLFNGDMSQLGPAERFLKVLVDIPFAFKRLESLLFMSILQEEVSSVKESFETLEVACKELRNSRLFLKLLEAVLKTGNRMNDGTFRGGAQAFKLDTLLKLSDVKGTDGKTTLLHFVVQEIIRSEGVRAARTARESQSMSSVKTENLTDDSSQETVEYYSSLGLQVVSGLSNDLDNVRKAALIDADIVTATVSKLGASLLKTREFLNNEMKGLEEDSEFHTTLANFVQHAEEEIAWLVEEDKRTMALVKSTADYFHGSAAKEEGSRLFVIVRDFLIILDKVCKQVKDTVAMPGRNPRRNTSSTSVSTESIPPSLPDVRHRLFPAITDRRMDDSSSDEESMSP